MKKFKLALQSLGFVFTSFLAAFGAPSDSNVQNEPIPGGVDIVGEGDTFIIQGDDIQDLPAPMPAVTPPLESHFSPPPPPQIFTPPSSPPPSLEK